MDQQLTASQGRQEARGGAAQGSSPGGLALNCTCLTPFSATSTNRPLCGWN